MPEAGIHSRRRFLRNAEVAIAGAEFGGVVAIASGTGDERRMPDLDGRSGVAQFCSVEQQGFAREGGAGQLLDVLVHQQLARAAVQIA